MEIAPYRTLASAAFGGPAAGEPPDGEPATAHPLDGLPDGLTDDRRARWVTLAILAAREAQLPADPQFQAELAERAGLKKSSNNQ